MDGKGAGRVCGELLGPMAGSPRDAYGSAQVDLFLTMLNIKE